MAQKIKDIAVKTGEYTDSSGQTKGRWQNVGSLMQGGDGGQFLILNRWFNPAGVPNPENRDSVLFSLFDPKQGGQQNQEAPQNQKAEPPPDDDDIPF